MAAGVVVSEVSTFTLTLLGLTVLFCAGEVGAQVCLLPESIQGTHFIPSEIKDNYTSGDLIIHFCEGPSGFGTVLQYCTDEGSWTLPNRKCTESPPIGHGTAVGFAFASFNLFLVIMVLLRNCFHSDGELEGGHGPGTPSIDGTV